MFVCRRHFLAVGNWLRANTRGHFSAFPSVLGRPSLGSFARFKVEGESSRPPETVPRAPFRPSRNRRSPSVTKARRRNQQSFFSLRLYKTCKASVWIFTYTAYIYVHAHIKYINILIHNTYIHKTLQDIMFYFVLPQQARRHQRVANTSGSFRSRQVPIVWRIRILQPNILTATRPPPDTRA